MACLADIQCGVNKTFGWKQPTWLKARAHELRHIHRAVAKRLSLPQTALAAVRDDGEAFRMDAAFSAEGKWAINPFHPCRATQIASN
jgi:hypothetical protein